MKFYFITYSFGTILSKEKSAWGVNSQKFSYARHINILKTDKYLIYSRCLDKFVLGWSFSFHMNKEFLNSCMTWLHAVVLSWEISHGVVYKTVSNIFCLLYNHILAKLHFRLLPMESIKSIMYIWRQWLRESVM